MQSPLWPFTAFRAGPLWFELPTVPGHTPTRRRCSLRWASCAPAGHRCGP